MNGRRSSGVKGGGEIRGGFETQPCSLQVFQEGLGPLVEEEVRWLIKPLAAVPVPIGLVPEGVATRALVKEVMEGVGGPATPAGKLILEDIGAEPTGIVGGEGVAHCKAEGSCGGMTGIDRQSFASLRVCVGMHGLPPKGVVVAIGGFGDHMFVDKGRVGAGSGRDGPFSGPPGEGTFAGNGFAIRSQLDPVKGGTGGDAAGRKGFKAGGGVGGTIEDSRGPDRCEVDGGVASDEGHEGGMEKEVLTLVGEATRVGHAGKSR